MIYNLLSEDDIVDDDAIILPNKETVAAMQDAERIAKDPTVKGYADLDALFADLKK